MNSFEVVKRADGKLETVPAIERSDTREQIAQMRRELREMLDGRKQFHEEPRAVVGSDLGAAPDLVPTLRVLSYRVDGSLPYTGQDTYIRTFSADALDDDLEFIMF